MLGGSVAITVVSGPGGGTGGPSVFALIALLLLGVIGVFVAAKLLLLVSLWPVFDGMAWGRRGAKAGPARCRKCGYDLRASPEYCPECGTPRPKEKVRAVLERGPAERPTVAYIVYFRTRAEVADLRIPIDQLQVIEACKRNYPEATELVLAPADRKRPMAVASEMVAAAAEDLLGALKASHGSPALETALRRVRQFARKHACKRLEREVGSMAALPETGSGDR